MTIGDLCDEGNAWLQTGPFGSQLHSYDYTAHGVPVVPTEAISLRKVLVDGLPLISVAKAKELSRHRLEGGDILFARRGVQATGSSALVKSSQVGWICGTGAIRLRVSPDRVDPDYLSFVLSAEPTVRWLRQHAVGAVMPNLNESIIRRLSFNLPPLPEQRRIAAILGALDEKIELKRRMSRTLEEMAQAIFKSWFVDFDSHEDLVDSALGPIPRGWQVKPVTALIEFNPKVRLERGATAPFADMKALPTDSAIADEVAARPFTGGGAKFCQGDTLLARITPCLENGKTALVDFLKQGEAGFGSTEFIVMRGRSEVSTEFVYCLARSEAFRAHAIAHMTGSSGRQRVQGDAFEHFPVAVPPAERLREFAAVAEPMFRKISANARESRTLAGLRDALLPKLISGELRIEDREHTEETAQC